MKLFVVVVLALTYGSYVRAEVITMGERIKRDTLALLNGDQEEANCYHRCNMEMKDGLMDAVGVDGYNFDEFPVLINKEKLNAYCELDEQRNQCFKICNANKKLIWSPPHHLCVLDRVNCSDLNANNICTVNATCINSEQEGICKCHQGFIDISNVPKEKIFQAGLITNLRQNVICLQELDIDECLLGLHNCSSVAICEDKAIGYSCRCPKDHVDGSPDPALKGRVCASVYSSKCGGRGTAIYTPLSGTYYCQCQKGYSGERCEVATGNVRLILVIILALIFLLLCFCCCIFFCRKCKLATTRMSRAEPTSVRSLELQMLGSGNVDQCARQECTKQQQIHDWQLSDDCLKGQRQCATATVEKPVGISGPLPVTCTCCCVTCATTV